MRSATSSPKIPHRRSRSRRRLIVAIPAMRGPGAMRASASAFPPEATATVPERLGGEGQTLRNNEKTRCCTRSNSSSLSAP